MSEIAGTTRDAIDARVTFDDKEYLFIDTAGLRRKHKEPEVVDKFARIRSMKAIERSDICLFMMDGTEGLTTQEKHYLKEIEKRGFSYIGPANNRYFDRRVHLFFFAFQIFKCKLKKLCNFAPLRCWNSEHFFNAQRVEIMQVSF